MLWGLICFVHPSQPLEEENNFEIWGARGIKLSRVWIICPSTVSSTEGAKNRWNPQGAEIFQDDKCLGKAIWLETDFSVLHSI